MLIDFTVKNFRSIKNEQTLSLVASDSTGDLIDNRIEVPGENFRLLPSAIIYGANASGKSNVVKALNVLWEYIEVSHKLSKDEPIQFYEPYQLDSTSRNEPSSFEVEFIADDKIRYLYAVRFDKKEVIFESLFYYPKKQKTKLFIREKGKSIEFGTQLKGHKKQIENILLANQLYLSVAVNNNLSQLDPVYRIFSDTTEIIQTGTTDELLSKMMYLSGVYPAENMNFKNEILRYINSADIAIDDIVFNERDNIDNLFSEMHFPQESASKLKNLFKYEIKVKHILEDNSQVLFDFVDESDGTQQLFKLAHSVIFALDSGSLLVIDEIDRSLHSLLSEFIISEFNSPERNPHGAQLIVTTHDISLMKPENFRRDQVWFTEKEKNGETKLYSLDEYDKDKVRGNTPFGKWYLEGRFDAIPHINRSLLPERK